ncbi:MAG: acyl-CoA dehydrogenase family protein [Planctomycetes bacterium]|nr:acyl-CoA dehydrogenase family protein [Planctomycetota bacterium]
MHFALNEEQQAIQETFHRFAKEKLKPNAAAIDEKAEFPAEYFRAVGELGFFGMRYPEEAGGSGNDVVSYCLAAEELAYGSLSVAAACAMQSLMGTYFLHRFGTKEQKKDLFAPALEGSKIGTICITEPDAGSDLSNISTTARAEGDGYVLNGRKMWITQAPVADFFTVFANFEDKLNIFLVTRDNPGLVVGRNIEKMGVKASVTSEVGFEDCRVPGDALLGEPGKGAGCLREILDEIRVMTGALAVGCGRAALEDSLAYANKRVQFGKPIAKFQAVKLHLAEMAMDLEVARRFVLYAAWRSDQGLDNTKEAAMAKLFASETGLKVCDKAARIFASYGYAMEYPIQRYLRDIRFTLIGGGTSEILKLIIAKEIGT